MDDGWYSERTATFGDRLAGAREAAGLGQEELARRLGVKGKTVKSWEDDLSEPRANRLQILAGLLNVSVMWLLTGRGEGVAEPTEIPADQSALTALITDVQALQEDLRAARARAEALESRLRRLSAGSAE